MRNTELLHMGMIGAALTIVGGLLSQGLSTGAGTSSLNLTSLFTPGADINQTVEALREALPEVRESAEKARPFLVIELAGYTLFALGFVGIWRMTRRTLGLVAFLGFLLAGVSATASYLMLPSALEELADALAAGSAKVEDLAPAMPSLLVLAGAGLLGLVGLVAGSLTGGYEFYRIGKELDHDFLRGSGVLMMATAVLSVVPLLGGLIVYAAIASVGISFHLLVGRMTIALKQGS